MKLSTRLAIAMSSLVVMAAIAIGFLVYRDLEAVLVPRALERIETRATLRATEIESYIRSAPADVLGFRAAAAAEGIMRAQAAGGVDPVDGTTLAAWRQRMARRFVAELEAKPSYIQFRIIGIADGGREVVRVERSAGEGTIRIVADDELVRRGDRDYVRDALAMPPGYVYFSAIDPQQDEQGALRQPPVPVQRVATVLQRADGEPFGIIVINIDMRLAFERIHATAPRTGSVYVVNERGEYLVHPDRAREFGFDLNGRGRLHDDLPEIAALIATVTRPIARMVTEADGDAVAAAIAPAVISGNHRVVVVETQPDTAIMAPVVAARQSIILTALAAIGAAILLSVYLSRSLSRPLTEMTAAVAQFGQHQALTVPISASGEVGILARAFHRMVSDVRGKTAELEREMAERRRIFDTSLDLILVVDRKGTFLQVSPSSRAILGYAPEEMQGRSAAGFIHPDDLDGTRAEMRLARHGHVMRNFETRYLHKDGHTVTLAWTGVWSEPEQQHFFIGRDMTEQRQVEEKFQLAVEACPNGMLMVDADSRIVMVNAAVEQLYGFTRDELIGEHVEMLVPPRMRNAHVQMRRDFAAKPEVTRMGGGREIFALRKDGSEFPIEVGLTPVHSRDGLFTLGVIVDVTERRRNERMKDEFVATVSHELRTPLTSIAASLGLLTGGAGGAIAEPVMRLLKVAHRNSERLVRLINDILDIEKMESGKIVLDLKKVDVIPLVEQAIDGNRGFAESFGVRVRLDPDAKPAAVHADPDRLMQVVTNLLSNAAKFSPRDSEVLVTVELTERGVRIAIRDRGPGIPEEFKARIFEKFAQADATDTRQKGGTGLGLSIVRQLATMFGGEVGFERPEDGAGTRFYVELPRYEFADLPRQTTLLGLPPRILICDDDRDVAAAIAARLEDSGFLAEMAFNGAQAMSMSEAHAFDAILVDLTLPDRDGISLIQDMRAQPRNHNTPIIVISFDSSRGREDIRSSSLNVLDWLDKPIDIGRVLQVLKRPLARVGGIRPKLLHIDDDPNVLAIVTDALNPLADVISAISIERARAALAAHRFDMAIVDIALSTGSGLDLLPELYDKEGKAIPVIVYSAQGANKAFATQVQVALTKSLTSIDGLIATLRKHMSQAADNSNNSSNNGDTAKNREVA